MKLKLGIRLIPNTTFYANVRSVVSPETWDRIKRKCNLKNHYTCTICGGSGTEQGYSYRVEVHEVWHYDYNTATQVLVGFTSLCPMCHKVKHIARVGTVGTEKEQAAVLAHFMKINGLNLDDTMKYMYKVQDVHNIDNRIKWKLDLSYVNKYIKGVKI